MSCTNVVNKTFFTIFYSKLNSQKSNNIEKCKDLDIEIFKTVFP